MPEPVPRTRSGRALLQHAAALAALVVLVVSCADDQNTRAQRQQQPAQSQPAQPAQNQPTQPARPGTVLTGRDARGDWTTAAPGVRRRITTADLPKPFATESGD